MKRTLLSFLLFVSLLVGCAYSIHDIDVSKIDQVCTRECTKSYSQCVSGGPSVGAKTETLRACRESFQVCTQTCPAK